MNPGVTFLGIALWALLPGFIAKKKGRSFAAYFFLSFLITPLITTIITLLLGEVGLPEAEQTVINGNSDTVASKRIEESRKETVHALPETASPPAESPTSAKESSNPSWACDRCGTVNPNYLSTCQCGRRKNDCLVDFHAKEHNKNCSVVSEPTEEDLNVKEQLSATGVLFCRECGTKLNPEARFCSECGTAVSFPSTMEKQTENNNDADVQKNSNNVEIYDVILKDDGNTWMALADKEENGDSLCSFDVPKERKQEDYDISLLTKDLSPTLRRAFILVEDGEWDKADTYFERVLDEEPENAYAYLGKLMIEKQASEIGDLAGLPDLMNNKLFIRAVQYADEQLSKWLQAT